ncbi:MAG: hypothetical protein J6S66_06880 [Bacteroidales bacterium]|nr:hypothetical protein [Bacteroidales bacterium]
MYKKTSAERLSLVQVSWIKPIIDPIPEDLSIKPRPETHFGVQARLVHHGIDHAGQRHIKKAGIALIPGVDEYSFFFSADCLIFTPINQSFDFHLTRCRMAANG